MQEKTQSITRSFTVDHMKSATARGRQGFRGLTLGPVFPFSTASTSIITASPTLGDVLAAAAKETSTQNPRLVIQKNVEGLKDP